MSGAWVLRYHHPYIVHLVSLFYQSKFLPELTLVIRHVSLMDDTALPQHHSTASVLLKYFCPSVKLNRNIFFLVCPMWSHGQIVSCQKLGELGSFVSSLEQWNTRSQSCKRMFAKISQSRRMPLLGPSPGLKAPSITFTHQTVR